MRQPFTKIKQFGKKAVTLAACAVAAVGLALGSLADSPDDLFSGVTQQQVIVAKAEADTNTEPEKKPTFRERLRRFFLGQPSVVRGLTLLPFWAAGKVLLVLIELLLTALSPVFQVLLGVLLNTLLLFGLFALVFKLLFPQKRLRDFLTRRNILLLAGGALLLSIADTVLRIFWEDYRPVSIGIKLAAGLLVLALLSWRIFGRRLPRNAALPA